MRSGEKVKIFLIKNFFPQYNQVYDVHRKDFPMKKTLFFLLLALSLFAGACSAKPNMETLLSYQRPGTEMTLRITDGEIFLAKLEITGTDTAITFTDGKREGISYRMDSVGEIFMFFEDIDIPIAPSDELKCKEWFSLFTIPTGDSIWKIKRETLGGISVYTCRDGRITLYIDAATGMPLKLESGRITVDVLSCETE